MTRLCSLIVVFDGMRPDMATPDLAPNLARFGDEHCRFPFSRSVFPTETRVNAAALVTGAPPGRHGIVANRFNAPGAIAGRPIDTGRAEDLAEADGRWDGALLGLPSLGERLHAAGHRLAVVSTASTGSCWLLHHRAEALGGLRFSTHGPGYTTPASAWTDITERFGPPPPAALPNGDRLRYATDVLLDWVYPTLDPEVAILWFSDPDGSYHYRGIGSPDAREAIRLADAEFGRILDWWRRGDRADRLQIVALSDHGQIIARERLDLAAALSEAGLDPADPAKLLLEPGSPAGFHLPDGDHGRADALVEWLIAQPWCGLIFSGGDDPIRGSLDGTLSRRLVQADHPRAPDIYATLRHAGSGAAAGTFYDNALPRFGGTHGGLHPIELNNLLLAGGSAFREGVTSEHPCGIVDVAPTLLHLLGLTAADGGRLLGEALVGGRAPDSERLVHAATRGRYAQRLAVASADGARYVDGGWRLDGSYG